MDLIFQLLYKFFIKEKWNTIFMFVFSILVNIIQTSGISIVTANLINTVKENNQNEIYRLLYILIGLFILFSIVFYIYKLFQNKIITKLHQWIRLELITLIMKHNNENFTDKNFIQLNAPINRISSVCFMFLNDICTFLIPIIIFILVVFCYFLYHDYFMGCAFIIANLIICIFCPFRIPF